MAQKPAFLAPEYPFEWAGTFEASEGKCELALDEGPDPTIDVAAVYLAADEEAGAPAARERARRLWAEPATKLANGGDVVAGASGRATLELAAGASSFTLRLPRPGRFGLYTQHLPSEFRLRLSRRGEALAPVAEEQLTAAHTHDAEVTSVGIHLDEPLDLERLNTWLSALLRENGADIFRMKGILNVAGSDRRFVFQGVHMLLDAREDRPWGAEERASDLIFIGRKLDREALTQAFRRCAAPLTS